MICDKSQDLEMEDEFDDALLITRLRSKLSLYYIGVILCRYQGLSLFFHVLFGVYSVRNI